MTNNESLPVPLPAIVEIPLPALSSLVSRTPPAPLSQPLFMRSFRGCQLSCHLKLPKIYEGVIDASVNICCKLKLIFLEKRL